MKNIIFIACISFSFNSTFAQKDLIERLEKQAVEIDSLKKISKLETKNKEQYIMEVSRLTDSIKQMMFALRKLEEFTILKKKTDSVLIQKSDSIGLLKLALAEKEKIMLAEMMKSGKKELEKYESGRKEIFDTIASIYFGKNLEDILKLTAGHLILRDQQLFHNTTETKRNLLDVEKYYKAKELFSTKPDIMLLKQVEQELGQIKQKSKKLDRIRELISTYRIFNDGFKQTLEKLKTLDNNESVSNLSIEVKKKKFDKVLAELSSFIFNYDFDFSEYPYHAAIFLEVIKRKLPNPDADISDLIIKL